MQKVGHLRITFLVLTFCLGISNGLHAQTARDTMGFTWKLLQVDDPSTEAKIQFTPLVQDATFTGWDFGDGNTNLVDSIAVNTYTTINTFDVDYNFKLGVNDSTITRSVIANSASFSARLDSNTNVTYVRILRSDFRFPENKTALLGDMRFEWTINGAVLIDTIERLVYFPGSFEQFPNLRYKFKNGGPNTVTLKAWNIADPAKFTTFSRTINILPDFTTKAKFQNLPNVFTPNGDGKNDNFIVPTSGTSELVFKVFTRTGVLIYQNKGYFINWDGKNDNGKDVPEGIYYYIIEDLDKQYESAKGFMYIFRG